MTVLVITNTCYTEVARLRHQICNILSKEHPTHWINIPYNRNDKTYSRKQLSDQLFYTKLRRKYNIPFRLYGLFSFLEKFYSYKLKLEIDNLKLGKIGLLITFDFRNPHLVKYITASSKVFILNDDFTLFSRNFLEKYSIKNNIKLTGTYSDRVLITSDNYQYLFKNKKSVSRIFPPINFKPIASNIWISNKKSKQINCVFLGAIDERLDYECIKNISNDPALNLTLIGDCSDNATRLLSKYKRINLLPRIKYNEINRCLMKYDVMIAMYKLPETWAKSVTFPNKLAIYISVGKPICIVGLKRLDKQFADVVNLSSTVSNFPEDIKKAYMNYNNKILERQRKLSKLFDPSYLLSKIYGE